MVQISRGFNKCMPEPFPEGYNGVNGLKGFKPFTLLNLLNIFMRPIAIGSILGALTVAQRILLFFCDGKFHR